MSHNDTIDVIIPTYNTASFLREAIESVVAQTYKPNKIIIVDDGSTDGTKDIVDSIKNNSKVQVQYIYQDNKGLSGARNTGIKASASKYIAFLDADDIWLPEKLFKQLEVFRTTSFKDLSAVYGDYYIVDQQGETIDDLKHIDPKIKGDVFDMILDVNRIAGSGSCILLKRSYLDDIGHFDENLKASEDWDMWLRIAKKYSFDFTEEKVVKIRKHGNNMQKNYVHMLANEIAFYNKWVSQIPNEKIPLTWKDNIATKIFLGLPKLDQLRMVKKMLSKQSKMAIFSPYHFIEVYLVIAFFKKIFKFIAHPSTLIKKIKGYRKDRPSQDSSSNSNKITPKVSVVMPVYNGSKFLSEAIESVINQTMRNFELIIVDDGSTDTSASIALKYAKKDPRIRLINNTGAKGVASALNSGLGIASEKYIARADADDILRPYRLKMQLDFLESHTDIDIVGGGYKTFGGAREREIFHPSTSLEIARKFIANTFFCHPTVMFRKSLVDTGHRYPQIACEDFAFFSKIIRAHKGHNIKSILIDYREHQTNVSILRKDQMAIDAYATFKNNYTWYTKTLFGAEQYYEFKTKRKLHFKDLTRIIRTELYILKKIRHSYGLSVLGWQNWISLFNFKKEVIIALIITIRRNSK